MNDQDLEKEGLNGGPGVPTQNGLSDSPKLNTFKNLTKQNDTQVFCFLAKMPWDVYTMEQLREGGQSSWRWIWLQVTAARRGAVVTAAARTAAEGTEAPEPRWPVRGCQGENGGEGLHPPSPGNTDSPRTRLKSQFHLRGSLLCCRHSPLSTSNVQKLTFSSQNSYSPPLSSLFKHNS